MPVAPEPCETLRREAPTDAHCRIDAGRSLRRRTSGGSAPSAVAAAKRFAARLASDRRTSRSCGIPAVLRSDCGRRRASHPGRSQGLPAVHHSSQLTLPFGQRGPIGGVGELTPFKFADRIAPLVRQLDQQAVEGWQSANRSGWWQLPRRGRRRWWRIHGLRHCGTRRSSNEYRREHTKHPTQIRHQHGRGRSLPWPALETGQPQTSEWARSKLEGTGFVTVEEWRAKPVTPNCLLTKPVTRNLTSASRAA
jgi:hypothetical protein